MTADDVLGFRHPLSDEQRAQVMQVLLANMEELGHAFVGIGGCKKPLLGGAFASGRFVLGSFVYRSGGLDRVRYTVLDDRSCVAIGTGNTVPAALDNAREMLTLIDQTALVSYCERVVAKRTKEKAEFEAERYREAEELAAERRKRSAAVGSVPRRRRRIFDASGGKCHYCGTALTLDGKWHIEHKMPRALLGTDEPSNLVASCVPCNTKKRDRTDVEFMAERKQAGMA